MYEKVEAQKSLGYKKHSCDENPTLFKSPEMNTLMMFYVYDVLHYAIEIIFFSFFFAVKGTYVGRLWSFKIVRTPLSNRSKNFLCSEKVLNCPVYPTTVPCHP